MATVPKARPRSISGGGLVSIMTLRDVRQSRGTAQYAAARSGGPCVECRRRLLVPARRHHARTHGFEHAEQAVVAGPRPLGEIVKLSRFCAKVFRITHNRARPLLDYAPLKIFNSRAFAAFQFGAYPRRAVTFRVKVATGAIDAGQHGLPAPITTAVVLASAHLGKRGNLDQGSD